MFFSKRFKIFRIGPIDIYVDLTWFIIFGVFSYILSRYFAGGMGISIFPLPLIMGIITVLLFFVCGLAHELAHSFMARIEGLEIKQITLFLLGMGAHLPKHPERPGQEFKMAIAGPLASFIIAALFWSVLIFLNNIVSLTYQPVLLVLNYLALINLVLAIFNLVPAFPMDGGRILRSIIWAICKNQIMATKVAVWTSRVMALLMIVIAWQTSNFFLILIAFLIFWAGPKELNDLVIQKKLRGKMAQDFMKSANDDNAKFWEVLGYNAIFCQPDTTLFEILALMQRYRTNVIFIRIGFSVIGMVDYKTIKVLLNSKELKK